MQQRLVQMKSRVLECLIKKVSSIDVHGHHCAGRGSHNWPQSVLSSRMVSSWRRMSFWKKFASLNANEYALIVTVLTCFSSASVFSSVRLMASW